MWLEFTLIPRYYELFINLVCNILKIAIEDKENKMIVNTSEYLDDKCTSQTNRYSFLL